MLYRMPKNSCHLVQTGSVHPCSWKQFQCTVIYVHLYWEGCVIICGYLWNALYVCQRIYMKRCWECCLYLQGIHSWLQHSAFTYFTFIFFVHIYTLLLFSLCLRYIPFILRNTVNARETKCFNKGKLWFKAWRTAELDPVPFFGAIFLAKYCKIPAKILRQCQPTT